MLALEARGLTRRYGALVAVDAIDLEVRKGEIVGVLGPNGAGKTTALQLCLKLLRADAGEVRIFGGDPEDLEIRRRTGYAPDAPLFPKALRGLEVLRLHADLLQASPSAIPPLVDELGLGEVVGRPCATYSKGQSQRLGLAQAMLGKPELLFLDEPTAGLDPAAVASMRQMLLRERERGTAVLLNSHLLSEVERLCDRVLFVKGGRILASHEVRSGGRRVEIRLVNPQQVGVAAGDLLRIPVASETEVPALVARLVGEGAQILEVRVGGEELEELYLRLVEGQA